MAEVSTTAIKALRALEVVGMHEGQRLAELQEETGYDKATLLRMLGALLQAGFVVKGDDATYRLGPAIYRFPTVMPNGSAVREWTRAPLEALVADLGETAHVGERLGHEVVYIDKVEPERSLRMASRLGATVPMHSSSLGKCILAFSEEDLLEAVIEAGLEKRTDATITDPEMLRAEVHSVAKRGYSVDNEENELNVRCVGAPIFAGDEVIAAISVSAPAVRLRLEDLPDVSDRVIAAAREISSHFGTASAKAAE